jgi:hypothetical protein
MSEPSITRCEPGRRTPKDQIRVRERQIVSPVALTTSVRGISGQTTLSRAQREDEAAIMSVALNQPHRRGLPTYQQTDADYFVSELGKFCRAYHDGGDQRTYRESTAFLRYRAGAAFAMVIDNDLVARGLAPRERGDGEWAGVPEDDALRARREACEMKRAEAEAAAREVDQRAVAACTKLCHDGLPLPDRLHGLTRNALYRLSLHFGIEKPGYHEARR